MIEFLKIFFLGLYIFASIGFMVYAFHCYFMIFLFLGNHRKCRKDLNEQYNKFISNVKLEDYPFVTIQLPVYNEAEVVERLILSASEVDYPRDKFEVQVIDDSTDDSRETIDTVADKLKSDGINIYVIRRDNRKDFKAGALANALDYARGEYTAIFDSDFLVPRHFLKRAISLLYSRPDVACIQGRWSHINRMENWLTKVQSIGIDGHFTAEQGARSYSGLCMNFNGTAGMWRVKAIHESGGWQGDTLTEDLDLSYRAQLAGYKMHYDLDLECPAEIPNNVIALKSQQKRWAKGSIETTKKLLPRILKSKVLTLKQKIEAFLHLTHYTVSIYMIALCLSALPVILMVSSVKVGWLLATLWILIIICTIAPTLMYTGSGIILKRGLFSFSHFPAMLAMGTGLCINNAFAVIEAIRGKKTDFIRTPKSGSSDTQSLDSRYKLNVNSAVAIIELILGVYCLITFVFYISSAKYMFGFYVGAYSFGLLTFSYQTLKYAYNDNLNS